MPFGLKNAPATLQQALDLLMAGLTWEEVLIYLDDLNVFAPTFEAFLGCLEHVFKRLVGADLKVKPSKCFFGFDSVKYLGHVVSGTTTNCREVCSSKLTHH